MRKFWIGVGVAALVINALGLWRGLSLYERSLLRRFPEPRLRVLPANGQIVEGRSPVVWEWDQAVIPAHRVGTFPAVAPARFTPEVPGAFAWESNRSLRFIPAKPWSACLAYNVRLDTVLTNEQGLVFAARNSSDFEGPPLRWIDARVINLDPSQRLDLRLSFNQTVHPADLRRHLTIRDERGQTLTYTLRETPVDGELLLQVNVQDTVPLVLRLAPGLISTAGPLGALGAQERKITLPTTFAFAGAETAMPSFGDGILDLSFTSAPDLARLRDALSFDPPLRFSVGEGKWWEPNQCRIEGDFVAGQSYLLKIQAGYAGLNGHALAAPVERRLVFPARRPGLKFTHDGQILNARGSLRVQVDTVGETELNASLRRVYDNNLVAHLSRQAGTAGWWATSSPDEGLAQSVWDKRLPLPPSPGPTQLDLGEAFKGQGLYRLNVHGKDAQQSIDRLILVSDLGLLVRHAGGDLQVWTVDLATGQAIAGAEVELWSRLRQPLARGRSDAQGLLQLTWPDDDENPPLILIARKGESLGVLHLSGPERVFPAEQPDRAYPGEGYEAFVYTDRGIHRPGETAHVRALLRGGGLAVPPVFPVTLRLHAPDGLLVWTETRTLSEFGSIEASVPLGDAWANGAYAFSVSLPGEKSPALGHAFFQLESFVPPQVVVEASVPEHERFAPREFRVKAMARMLYGGPAAQHAASAAVTVSAEDFRSSEHPHHSFSDDRKNEINQWHQALGAGQTDAEGVAFFTVSLPPELRGRSALRAVVAVTVNEFSGRAANTFVSRRVDQVPHYIGVKATPLGDGEAEVDVVAVLPDGKALPGERAVDLEWSRLTWSRGYRRDGEGRFTWVSEEVPLREGSQRITLRDGRGMARIPVAQGAMYRVAAFDGPATSSATARVSMGAAAAPDRADRVEINLAGGPFRSGQVIRANLHAPFTGTALVSLEDRQVLLRQVIALTNRTQTVELTLPESVQPNLWLRVSLLRPQPGQGAQAVVLSEGGVLVRMDQETRRLPLVLEVAPSLSPAKPASVLLRGTPGAEVVLAGVDEGILGLTNFQTPDPFAWFTAARRAILRQWDVFDTLIPELGERFRDGDSAMGGGAAGALRQRINPIDAKRFKPLAWWSGAKRIGADGTLRLDVPLPEFTGEIRWMAVAVDAHTFGAATASSKVARQVVVQQSLPLFLAPGDSSQWRIRLHNRGETEATVTLSAKAGGPVRLRGGEAERFTLAAGEARLFDAWELDAGPGIGVARCALDIRANDEAWSDEIELGVRPLEAFRVDSALRVLAPGERVTLSAWTNVVEGTGKRFVQVSGLPVLQTAGALDALVRYPYGCLEQTVSCAFPLLDAAELAAALGESLSVEGAKLMAQEGVFRLWRMQLRDGSFAYWPGSEQSLDHGSVYALEFLVAAKAKGLEVDERFLGAGLRWLEGWMAQQAWDDKDAHRLSTVARACAVLAQAGTLDSGWVQRLRERREALSASGRAYAAEALLALGERAAAGDMLSGITGGGQAWSWYSNGSHDAHVLRVLLAWNPWDTRVPGLLQKVMSVQRNGQWLHTYENASVVRALAAYARVMPKGDGKLEVVRSPATGQEQRMDTNRLSVAVAESQAIRNAGASPVYLLEQRAGVPLLAPAVTNAFQVVRSLHLSDGTELDADTPVKSGERVLLRIRLSGIAQATPHLVLSERLPAGLEPLPLAIQRALENHSAFPGVNERHRPEHLEIRDDRVLIFPHPVSGSADFYILTQAVSAGKFQYPASAVQHMYEPALEARGEARGLWVLP